mmetsp:Transcript_14794/g.31343  ORF Transcript_14794/g.31343 Transcript_14794/m.31343 type:complete len:372 (+) Transcript_14794:519-1634(+)
MRDRTSSSPRRRSSTRCRRSCATRRAARPSCTCWWRRCRRACGLSLTRSGSVRRSASPRGRAMAGRRSRRCCSCSRSSRRRRQRPTASAARAPCCRCTRRSAAAHSSPSLRPACRRARSYRCQRRSSSRWPRTTSTPKRPPPRRPPLARRQPGRRQARTPARAPRRAPITSLWRPSSHSQTLLRTSSKRIARCLRALGQLPTQSRSSRSKEPSSSSPNGLPIWLRRLRASAPNCGAASPRLRATAARCFRSFGLKPRTSSRCSTGGSARASATRARPCRRWLSRCAPQSRPRTRCHTLSRCSFCNRATCWSLTRHCCCCLNRRRRRRRRPRFWWRATRSACRSCATSRPSCVHCPPDSSFRQTSSSRCSAV